MDLTKLKEEVNTSHDFSQKLGLVITRVSQGSAESEMPVTEGCYNPFRTVHGGILFTIADVTGGVAAYSYGSPVCTVDSDFHYLNAGLRSTRLYASAQELKAGKRLLVYDVSVRDQTGLLLCKGTFTYSKLGQTAQAAR